MARREFQSCVALRNKIDPVQKVLLKEFCILVDEKDTILGKASKRKCHQLDSKGKSLLHRAFSLFIFNEKNELLLQRRSKTKITFPGFWTNTCCSHPLFDVPGESNGVIGAKTASRRRVFNELGIQPESLPLEKIQFLTRILYAAPSQCKIWGENELDYIMIFKGNVVINPNPEEVYEVLYLKYEDMSDFVKEESSKGTLTPWFEIISKEFLPRWWKSIDNLESFVDKDKIHSFY
uniref:isopentenyl-diphosphate Delta-isomerase n=1 Tax=Lepeophtheirus salmonis TaxID=72036 RepID=D3PK71_LEPSM|nr:Isopentenyl-diphosphate Delta-isomerase 1 [Lepeophtheirus salmonis]